MATRIQIKLNVITDFHIGTGSGRGRSTDSTFLRDLNGIAYIPGSTIKGLVAWQARQLVDLYPNCFSIPNVASPGPIYEEVFGGGRSDKVSEDRVWFNDAVADPHTQLYWQRNGRSAQDRVTRRARDNALFFMEDVSGSHFDTSLHIQQNLSKQALLLLLISLRRVDALGGQRRRGKGQTHAWVKVVEADFPELNGIELPGDQSGNSDAFRKFAQPLLKQSENNYQPGTTPAISGNPVGLGDWTCWQVFCKSESALTFGAHQATDNIIDSMDFVSGTSVRGSMAWTHLRQGLASSSDLFRKAIIEERLVFGPLYPAASDWYAERSMPMPTPASFFTCKHHPGAAAARRGRSDGWMDRFRISHTQRCPVCNAPLVQAEQYVQTVGDDRRKQIVTNEAPQVVLQRTKIDPVTQRGEDEALYSTQAIQRGYWFAGYIWGPKDLGTEFLRPWVNGRDATLRLGKHKSRGQGKVTVFAQQIDDGDYPGLCVHPSPQCLDPSADTFTLTLYSDLIELDDLMRPVTTFTEAQLWKTLGGTGDLPFEFESGFVSTRTIGGFLGAVGLSRTVDVAIAAGSCWKLKWTVPDKSKAIQTINDACKHGIGIRRAEGFGRIIADHPLHSDQANFDAGNAQEKFRVIPTGFARGPEAEPFVQPMKRQFDELETGVIDVGLARLLHEAAQQPHPPRFLQEKIRERKRTTKKNALASFLSRQGFDLVALQNLREDDEQVVQFRRSIQQSCGLPVENAR